jgi:hypothetical protein
LRKSLIIHWRSFVGVVEACLLKEVDYQKGNSSNWEEFWNTKAIHEGDEDDLKDFSVLDMHLVIGSAINVKVSLD